MIQTEHSEQRLERTHLSNRRIKGLLMSLCRRIWPSGTVHYGSGMRKQDAAAWKSSEDLGSIKTLCKKSLPRQLNSQILSPQLLPETNNPPLLLLQSTSFTRQTPDYLLFSTGMGFHLGLRSSRCAQSPANHVTKIPQDLPEPSYSSHDEVVAG